MNQIFKLTAIGSLLFSISCHTLAAYQTLDTIIATAGNDAITQNDLHEKIAIVKDNFKAQGQLPPSEDEIKKQVLDKLIIESLQLQLAEQSGLQISEERLAQTMTKIAERKNMSESELRARLEEEGIPYEKMREQIRKDLTLQQLQQSKLRHKIQISEQEVDNYLDSAEGKKITASRYKMSHILIALPENTSPEKAMAAKKALSTIRQNILNNQYSFSSAINANNLEGYSLEGGSLDWLNKDGLPSLFSKALKTLKKGGISNPIRSNAGWHLVMLDDVDGGLSEIVHQVSSRHILIKLSEVRNNEQAKKLADDLYQKLQKGEDFTLVAKEYSEDPGSMLQGGNLGWTKPSQFVPAFAQTLEKLKVNEMSPPFKTEFGWHILEKLDERDHDMTLENQKNQAYQAIYERKFTEELETWLITLREESFVEIRQ